MYYKFQCDGLIYQLKQDDQQKTQGEIYGYIQEKEEKISRPIKKVYINFDRDNANKMFGYRVRFDKPQMKSYMQEGIPSCKASQEHKPIHFLTYDLIKTVTDRYSTIENYSLKQTIVRVLDSDNEEDISEIEKNRRVIQNNRRMGLGNASTNPKIKKRYKNLPWTFDRPDSPVTTGRND